MNLRNVFVGLGLCCAIFLNYQYVNGQSCDGADGIFPPLSGNTVIANGDLCANTAVLPYRWQITYTNVDDGGNPASVTFFIDWGDGTTQTVGLGAGDNFLQNPSPNSYIANVTHLFPAGGANVMCEYIPTVSLRVNGVICPSTIQNPSPVVRWNTDDENTGVMELSEQGTGNVIYEVCAGETVTVRFIDRSEFNCVPANFPGFPPNIRTRWFQFIYGGDPVNNTISGSGITINTNTGSNPEAGGIINLGGGGTYASQVVQRNQPILAPTEYTFDITVPADAQVGEEFAITLNNWNFCNPYQLGGIPTGNVPSQFTGLIRIITSPDPPLYTPVDYCVNDPINLTVFATSGGTIRWYSDAATTNQIATGPTMNPVTDPPVANRVNNTIPGTYTYYATETLGNNCEGPAVPVDFEVFEEPTVPNAGPDQTICANSTTLAANTPAIGTGQWQKVSGPGTITNINLPNSTITGLTAATPTVLRWVVTNGPCSQFDEMTIGRDPDPDVADAGTDQFECNIAGATLSANTPSVGTGTWTQVAGPGATITNPTNPGSTVTGLAGGNVYTFRWTITNGVCADSFDEVSITTDLDPPANGGGNFSICFPANSANLNATPPPIGTGVWSKVSGPGIIADVNNPTSAITNITGTTILNWTVSNGVCVDVDVVTITIDNAATVAVAGPPQAICGTSATMAANTPVEGIGTWTVISGSGTFANPNNPVTTVTDVGLGSNVYRWRIENSCNFTQDDVTITNNSASPAIAGPDQVVCGGNTVLAASPISVGTGTWTVITGNGAQSFGNINSPTSTFTGTPGFVYTLQWNVNNGGVCPDNTDQVVIDFDAAPTIANAGSPQVVCANNATLAANTPTVGTGTWSKVSGPGGSFNNTSNPSAVFTGTRGNTYVLRWTITNGTCVASTSDVTIQMDRNPTTAAAGPDQIVCGNSTTLAGNSITVGTGTWSEVSGDGNGVFSNANQRNSTFSGTAGVTYTLRWRSANGAVCSPSDDFVSIRFDAAPTVAFAGANQVVCGPTTNLNANAAVVGIGTWTEESGDGAGNFSDPNNPTAVFTGTPGQIYQLKWSISNGICPVSESNVTIQLDQEPTISVAGTDQLVCGGSTSINANAAIVGSGLWTVISDPDGLGIITSPTSNVTTFSGTPGQTYRLRWAISNGSCTPSESEIEIAFVAPPSPSDAGIDQIICTNNTILDADIPTVGTGQWSILSNPDGNGVITDVSDPVSTFTGSNGVNYILRWTISNGICPVSTDEVTISIGPAIAPVTITGPAQACIGDVVTYTIPGGNPAIYTYTWDLSGLPASTTVVAGSGTPFHFISLQLNDAATGNLTVNIADKVSSCVGPNTSVPLTIFNVPDMILDSDDSDLFICQGDQVIYTATDLNGVATRYDFILNGVTVQSGPSNTYSTSILPVGNNMVVRGFGTICPSLPSNPITHVVNLNPIPFNVLGGGEICVGDQGLQIRLASSIAGETYELYRDDVPTGITVASVGGQVNFPLQDIAGVYTVYSMNVNSCVTKMNGSASIIVNPLPQVFDLTGGGNFCQGTTGLSIALSGSVVTDEYRVIRNGLPFSAKVQGTGNAMIFGPFNVPGTYQVEASNPEKCDILMAGQAVIAVDPLPTVTETNNSPTICTGEETSIVLESNLGNSTFTWTVSFDPALVSGPSPSTGSVNEGDIIQQTLVNLTNVPVQVQYSVTPDNGCTGASKIIQVVVYPAPTATISSDALICLGDDHVLEFNATGQIPLDLEITVNGVSEIISGVSNSHSLIVDPVVTTVYQLIRVTDANGCTTLPVAEEVIVEVLNPVSSFTTADATLGCSPMEVNFENLSLDPQYTYTWSWGDGSPSVVSSDQFVSHIFENASTSLSRQYTVTLTAVFNNGTVSCTALSTMSVTVHPNVVPDIVPSALEGCAPLVVNFENKSRGAQAHQWFYRVKGSNDQLGQSTAVAPQYQLENTSTSPLVYEIVYTASNVNCANTQIVEITVYPDTDANFTINGSQTPAAVLITDPTHAVIQPSAAEVPGWSYLWEYGDGTTSSDYQPISPYTWANAGDYSVRFTVTEPGGNCTESRIVDLRVEAVAPIIQFTANPREGCRPLVVDFINQSISVDPSTYLWEFIKQTGEVVGTSNEANPTFTFYDAGIYSVRLSGKNILGTGASEFKENYIEVFSLPTAAFLYRPDKVFLPGGTLFTENRSINAVSFQWDFGDGNTSDLFEPEHQYTQTGSFPIELIAYSAKGCTDTLKLEGAVEVIEGGTLRVPNAFTPNLSGPTGGIPGAGTFNDVFRPIVEGASEFNMQIFDRWGNLIFESNDPEVGWDGYDRFGKLLPTGVYVYKMVMKFSNGEFFEKIGDVTLIR